MRLLLIISIEGLRGRVVELQKHERLVCTIIMTGEVKICQWYNGLIQTNHVTPHTSRVKFGPSIVFDLLKKLQHRLSQKQCFVS